MASGLPKPVFLDATVPSNFASTDAIDYLVGVLGIERGHLDVASADDWLETWRRRRGYYAPVESVSEVVDDG